MGNLVFKIYYVHLVRLYCVCDQQKYQWGVWYVPLSRAVPCVTVIDCRVSLLHIVDDQTIIWCWLMSGCEFWRGEPRTIVWRSPATTNPHYTLRNSSGICLYQWAALPVTVPRLQSMVAVSPLLTDTTGGFCVSTVTPLTPADNKKAWSQEKHKDSCV